MKKLSFIIITILFASQLRSQDFIPLNVKNPKYLSIESITFRFLSVLKSTLIAYKLMVTIGQIKIINLSFILFMRE